MSKSEIEDKKDFYLAAFRGFEDNLNGETSSALHQIRRHAIDRFSETGFPTGRDEDWRHTSVSAVTRSEFVPALTPGPAVTDGDLEPFCFPGFEGIQLVFVNGHLSSSLSTVPALPAGVRVGSLATAFAEEPELPEKHLGKHADCDLPGFAALNTAFVTDGAFVHLPSGVALERPIHLLYLSAVENRPSVSFPRTLIVAGDGARGSVVETFAGLGDSVYLTDAVTEIVAGDDSVLDHCKIQRESDAAFHVGVLHVTEGDSCKFASHSAVLNGQLVRNDTTTLLDGEAIESTLNGVFLGGGDSRIDNHTTIEHAKPNCSSHELYKGVLGDRSKGVFRGKIHVHQVAQKTDAYQSNQNLLLSEDADITSKPQLEIYADDVKCSHGSTTGQLDAEAIFYLRSRGIGEKEAIATLTRAFAGEIVDRIPIESVRQKVGELVSGKLSSLLGKEER